VDATGLAQGAVGTFSVRPCVTTPDNHCPGRDEGGIVTQWKGRHQESGDDNRCCISEDWAGRLEIIFTVICIIARTAGQIATRTIARLEFDVSRYPL